MQHTGHRLTVREQSYLVMILSFECIRSFFLLIKRRLLKASQCFRLTHFFSFFTRTKHSGPRSQGYSISPSQLTITGSRDFQKDQLTRMGGGCTAPPMHLRVKLRDGENVSGNDFALTIKAWIPTSLVALIES